MTGTVSSKEIKQFQSMAEDWWSPEGSSKPLHLMNSCRVSFIREEVATYIGQPKSQYLPFEHLSILDIGCGGGILSEALARLGGKVTGIDATPELIAIAKQHALESNLNITYASLPLEAFIQENDQEFDFIVASEVLEHVENVPLFLSLIPKILKKEGLFIASTINRTPSSYLKAIIGAEYLLRLIPKGTHSWHKFLKPSELAEMSSQIGLHLKRVQGLDYSPFTQKWTFVQNPKVNFIASFQQ